MSPELRQALGDAAGRMEDLPDLDAISRRSRVMVWRRRAVRVAVACAIVFALATSGRVLDGLQSSAPFEPAERTQLDGRPLPGSGPLRPVTYAADEFEHPFSITIRSGGWLLGSTRPTWTYMTREGIHLHVQVWDRVLGPTATNLRPAAFDDAPVDLLRWFAQHPRLDISNERSVQLGALDATRIDVRVTDPLTRIPPECEGTRCAIIAGVRDLPELVNIDAGQLARLYIVEGPEPIVISWRDEAGTFDRTASRMDAVAETIRFAP